jgi:hypothetical protein
MEKTFTIQLLNGDRVDNALIESKNIEDPIIEGDRVFLTSFGLRFSISIEDYNEIISEN